MVTQNSQRGCKACRHNAWPCAGPCGHVRTVLRLCCLAMAGTSFPGQCMTCCSGRVHPRPCKCSTQPGPSSCPSMQPLGLASLHAIESALSSHLAARPAPQAPPSVCAAGAGRRAAPCACGGPGSRGSASAGSPGSAAADAGQEGCSRSVTPGVPECTGSASNRCVETRAQGAQASGCQRTACCMLAGPAAAGARICSL